MFVELWHYNHKTDEDISIHQSETGPQRKITDKILYKNEFFSFLVAIDNKSENMFINCKLKSCSLLDKTDGNE